MDEILECGSHRGKSIAVLTSGGDAPGMNAALKAVVRAGLYLGCKVYAVHEGYQGLVDGQILEIGWSEVTSIIHHGGTVIGSARCSAFRTREGRLKAAQNLVNLGIFNLVIIGGDGSLTGANQFRKEWTSLLDELFNKDMVDQETAAKAEYLNIVGLVGSIDNDFAGTDMTIGTDSALHRILEAIDSIVDTAQSHQRTFILEVMGRNCGYLALSAGFLCSATFVFIPEEPPEDWEDDLCETMTKEKEDGQRLHIIVVAEGAIDRNGAPITSEKIKDVVVERLQLDTRITILGHIQRGGSPSAFDRILACKMGVDAVIALLDSTPEAEPEVISLEGNHNIRVPLMECVRKTQEITQAMAEKNWAQAIQLRGRSFMRTLEVYKMMHSNERTKRRTIVRGVKNFNLAIIHIGAPACGMNATVRSFVRFGLSKHIRVYGVSDGIDGLLRGEFQDMQWEEVTGWVGTGGALLGTKRTLPRGHFRDIAYQLNKYRINGLYIVGGFEAFQAAIELYKERDKHPEFCIPILVTPATISNNVPGSDVSLGCDTALNDIVEICDKMRQAARGTKRRVYIMETMGGYCGYLATMGAIAGGADTAYIYEEKFSIKDLHKDLYNMASKMCSGIQRGLVLRNEKCNENYNIDFMRRLYAEEGQGVFSTRSNVIGHVQQGGNSSPIDRKMGTTLGMSAINWFSSLLGKITDINGTTYTKDEDTVMVLGLVDKHFTFTSVMELAKETDFEKKIPKVQWWMKMRPLLKIIAKHESTYDRGSFIFYERPVVA